MAQICVELAIGCRYVGMQFDRYVIRVMASALLAIMLLGCSSVRSDATEPKVATETAASGARPLFDVVEPSEKVTTPREVSNGLTKDELASAVTTAPKVTDGGSQQASGGCPAPDPKNGAITGVEEWVNKRSSPSLEGNILGQISARSLVVYYPSTLVYDELGWVQVYDGSQCAWVGGTFVKDSFGTRTVAPMSLGTYVFRALRGLEPELNHATQIMVGHDEYVAFDPWVLYRPLEDLRGMYWRYPDIKIVPGSDSIDGEFGAEPGCRFSHGFYCTFRLISGGETVAWVDVEQVGDGVTHLSLVEVGGL